MHFFMIDVRAKAGVRMPKSQQRAVVECWVDFPLQSGALAIARLYIADDGYRVTKVREHGWIGDPKKLQPGQRGPVRDARRFGACFVYRHELKRTAKP